MDRRGFLQASMGMLAGVGLPAAGMVGAAATVSIIPMRAICAMRVRGRVVFLPPDEKGISVLSDPVFPLETVDHLVAVMMRKMRKFSKAEIGQMYRENRVALGDR